MGFFGVYKGETQIHRLRNTAGLRVDDVRGLGNGARAWYGSGWAPLPLCSSFEHFYLPIPLTMASVEVQPGFNWP